MRFSAQTVKCRLQDLLVVTRFLLLAWRDAKRRCRWLVAPCKPTVTLFIAEHVGGCRIDVPEGVWPRKLELFECRG